MSTHRIATSLLASLFLSASLSAAVFGRPFTLPEYVAELNRLTDLAQRTQHDPSAADAAINELRGDWKVESDGSDFEVNTGWMVDHFDKLKKHGSDRDRNELIRHLKALETDAEAFQSPPPDSAAARSSLNEILARNEFHSVRGPNWYDRLKYKILSWIARLLFRAFGSSSVPIVGKFVVWGLVAIAVLLLAFFIFRTIRQNARLTSVVPQITPVSAKGWRIWMDEAQAAAAEGLWRDAVHLAYWAGISFLEGSGMWKPDQARTPREYLRLLPAGSEHRSELSALTRNLEVTWYGNQPAGQETFAETLSHLEKLGCHQA